MFIKKEGHKNETRSLNTSSISTFFTDSEGQLWIGADGQGLFRYDPATDEYSLFLHSETDNTSISTNSVHCISEDRSHILWFGNFGGGINYYDLNQKKFEHIRVIPHVTNGLSHNIVRAICNDSSGNLWVGTDGGGLDVRDAKTGHFRHFGAEPGRKGFLQDNVITALFEDSRKTMWVGTYRGGLYSFNPASGLFMRHDIQGGNPMYPPATFIRVIREDRAGRLLIGTIDAGFVRYDSKTGAVERFINNPADSTSLSHNSIVSIYEEPSGDLWLGTWGGGLNRFDGSKGTYTHYVTDDDNKNSLSHDSIICIFSDRTGTIWIGTAGGLNRYERETGSFTVFTIEDGLPNNVIYGILDDDQGNLWISTNNGLSKFDVTKGKFLNFTVNDGLQSNEFSLAAYCKGRDGRLYFGGINGLNAFHPSDITVNTYIPPCVITGFSLFNRPVGIGPDENKRTILSQSITLTDQITLLPGDFVFSFEFASLHYAAPESNYYAYYMEGFDKEWNFIGNRKFATYTNLPHGAYVFRVKGTNSDGIWNDEGASIRIVVKPSFWETVWFKLSLLGFLVGTLIGVNLVVTENIKRRNRELEKHNLLLNEQINERQLAEKALRENEERFRTVVESSRDGIVAIDCDGSIIFANPAAENIFGSTKDEIIGKRFESIVSFDNERASFNTVFNYMSCGEDHFIIDKIMEMSARRGDGEFVPVAVSLSRGMFGDKPFILAVIRDMTNQKQLEEQLQIRERMDSLGTLAGGIAHDFNNLLVGIMGNLELLAMDNDTLTVDQREYVDDATQLCQRAAKLIKNFQTLSKEQISEIASFDIYTVVQDVFAILERTTDKLIGKIVDIEPGKFFVLGQAERLHQVFLNLGTNAAYAIGEKGIVPGDYIRISAHDVIVGENDKTDLDPGEYVHVVFEDTGRGMTPDVKRKAFEPFFTTKQRGTVKGQGLGLAMVFNIITRFHGGHISIDSTEGKGTSFHIYLKKAEVIMKHTEADTTPVPGGTETILIVEDEDSIMRVLTMALKRFGYSVITASDGQEGVDRFLEHKDDIDLVLLDLSLPKMSGHMVLDHIIAINPGVKVIISSGQSEEEMQKYSGVRAYVLKPYKMLELSSTIRNVLDGD